MKDLFRFNCLLIQLVLFFTCDSSYQIDKYTNQEINCAELRPGQTGFIQLVNNNEPGEPLVVYGKIVDSKTKQPIRNVSIFLYQTDNNGIYSSSGRDEDARIKGTVYTNDSGCFKIKTILPGDYPGQKNSRHLHYVINATGYIEKKSLLFFKGFTTPNITGQGPLIVLDIHKDATGTWIGSTDFYLEKSGK
jgi:protocatechuate 3,4-dioxygenase beta subunit